MTKYQPLADFLGKAREDNARRTFREIEATLGFPLPRSARKHAAWWSNHAGGHVQAKAWLDAGWQAWEVDLKEERVLFRRAGAAGPPPLRPVADFEVPPAHVCVEVPSLTQTAARLLRDYTAEMNGDASAALARAVHEAAVARRGRLVRQWRASAPRIPPGEPDSVALIREDRDAR